MTWALSSHTRVFIDQNRTYFIPSEVSGTVRLRWVLIRVFRICDIFGTDPDPVLRIAARGSGLLNLSGPTETWSTTLTYITKNWIFLLMYRNSSNIKIHIQHLYIYQPANHERLPGQVLHDPVQSSRGQGHEASLRPLVARGSRPGNVTIPFKLQDNN